jgi:hypothetical protein
MLIFFIGKILLDNNEKKAYFLAFLFIFCTSVTSVVAFDYWQHSLSVLLLLLTFYLFIKVEVDKNAGLIQYTSIPLAFSYVVRPTNSISIIFLSLYVLLKYKKYFIKYFLWSLTIGLPFIIYNIFTFNNILPPYYSASRLSFSKTFLEALVGNLISPARGLFIFTPFLLFIFYGIYLKIKKKNFVLFDWIILIIIIFHWFIISSFSHWWAGYSFGPRFFTDMLPYLIYFIIPYLEVATFKELKTKIFVILVVISCFIHMKGLFDFNVQMWNVTPQSVD